MGDWLRFTLAALLAMLLSGCASHGFLLVGVGYVRIDHQDRAVGVRSIMVGLQAGCSGLSVGAISSYCARIPIDGNVAILEQGSRPSKHLVVHTLKGDPDEVFATARDR